MALNELEEMADEELAGRLRLLADKRSRVLPNEGDLLRLVARRLTMRGSTLQRIANWPTPSDGPAGQERTNQEIRDAAKHGLEFGQTAKLLCQTIQPVYKERLSKPCGQPRSAHKDQIGPCSETGCDAFRHRGEWRAVGYVDAGRSS